MDTNNSIIKIEWLNKNDRSVLYAKYALMEFALSKNIEFIRVSPRIFKKRETKILDLLTPAQAFFVVYYNDMKCKVIIDTSESFFYISPALKYTDLYFFTSYNSNLFENHKFLTPYSWQIDYDLSSYKDKFMEIEKKLGQYFNKILRFIPFPVVMDIPVRRFSLYKKIVIINLILYKKKKKLLCRQKLSKFDPEYLLLKTRYQQLLGYRFNKLKYDVVIRESLWAWPWHRVLLYKSLQGMKDRKIFSSLKADMSETWWKKYIPEGEIDNVIDILQEKNKFPDSYEEMITSSRLAVFPTGKHWGWRAITFLSLMSGGPIFMDKPIFEPYFPLQDFKLFFSEKEWMDTGDIIDKISDKDWVDIRKHNQDAFDKYLSPLSVGNYLYDKILEWFHNQKKVNVPSAESW